ncbi:carbohydrate binding domain-containing protein [Streptomyces orinoci]|uniref:Carbohydrate binding domain-containing protein n=1 Tax=Streptomyces orinoci TaxID=67339 RepID=A0ABV3JUN9_STRON|nr:carbohydrate binding domain-containing protein [Streptomyces orinoci]
MPPLRTRLAHLVGRAVLATLLTALAAPLAAPLASAAPAVSSQTGGPISRWEVIQRAKTWTDAHVPYLSDDSPRHRKDGYRTDCSGFVSMAWHLSTDDGGPATWQLPKVADPISKDQLATGDILLMLPPAPGEPGHVVIFIAWTNAEHTRYEGMEEAGGNIKAAVQRELSYPYSGDGDYRPYHYRKITDNAPSQNLLNNADFEDGGGWSMTPGSNLTTYCDSKAHSGRCHGAVNTGSLNPAQGPSFFQDIWGGRMEPGTTYTFTLWVRPENNKPYQGHLALWALGDGTADHTENAFTAQPGTWQKVTVTERIPADGFHHLRAEMYENTPHDTLDVDDATATVHS